MKNISVAIIGGGVAGLAAAVFLKNSSQGSNLDITIIEGSPKLGGRAYSFYDKERDMYFDNGQHILAGWYENTLEYLTIIGSIGKLNFQKNLEINFYDTNKNYYELRLPGIKAPYNALVGLLRFKKFGIKDKLAVFKIKDLINYSDDTTPLTALDLLKKFGQTPNIINYFWEPFIYAVFNTSPKKVSAEIFLNILRLGFLKGKSSTLIIPQTDLNSLLINDAVKYLEQKQVKILKGIKVARVNIDNDSVSSILLEDNTGIQADYIISAVPFFTFPRLFEEQIYNKYFSEAGDLAPSSITSVHIFFEKDIPPAILKNNSFGMTGLIGTSAQWIFKRSSRHISIVISGSDEIGVGETALTDRSSEDIYNIVMSDLIKCISGFENLNIEGYKVIKEKRATFIPGPGSNRFRTKMITGINNLFVAGDWTDTGLPATIESAVMSAKLCSEKVIESINKKGA